MNLQRLDEPIPSNLLHWTCCVFIGIYVLANQYFYAVSDRLLFADHDWQFLRSVFENYNKDPSGQTLSFLRDFISGEHGKYTFAPFLASLNFLAWGRTLVAFKMGMAGPLLGLALATYSLTYSVTKRELAGLLAAIIVLNLPFVVSDSRTYFAFIATTAACLFACSFIIDNLDLGDARSCALFMVCLGLCSLIHYSALIYFPFLFAFLFYSNKNRTRYAIMIVGCLLIGAWSRTQFMAWLAWKMDPALNSAIASYPSFYRAIVDALSERLVILFVINTGALLLLRLAYKCLFDHIAVEIDRRFVFLYLFLLYVLPIVGHAPVNATMIFFALWVILFVAMVFLIGKASLTGRARLLWRWIAPIYMAFCLGSVMNEVAIKARNFTILDRPARMGGYYSTNRLVLEDDMADLSTILLYLDKENRRAPGGNELNVLRSSATLCDDGRRTWLEEAIPLDERFSEMDSTELVTLQAFYQGIKINWKDAPLLTKPTARKMADRDTPRNYLFLTLVHQTSDAARMWDMPEEGTVLAKIKEQNADVYGRIFPGSVMLTSCRMHRNLFLYIFRIRSDPNGTA